METDSDGDLVLKRRSGGQQIQEHANHLSPEQRSESEQEEDVVLSEVHLECRATEGSTTVTAFHHSGGLLEVEHKLSTPLSMVGLQVWRGALLLADYILHASSRFDGCTALELGCGPGVAGLLAAQHTRLVFLTDMGLATLQNCQANLQRNAGRLPRGAGSARVRRLDWRDPPDWLAPCGGGSGWQAGSGGGPPGGASPDPCAWQTADIEALQGLQFILAADCIYDNDLTEAFMRMAVQLMRRVRRAAGPRSAGAAGGSRCHRAAAAPGGAWEARPGPALLVALERRITFTLRDMDARAPAYDYWRTLFEDKGAGDSRAEDGSSARVTGTSRQGNEEDGEPGQGSSEAAGSATRPLLPLAGRRLDVAAVPQQVRGYERSDLLELWELWLVE